MFSTVAVKLYYFYYQGYLMAAFFRKEIWFSNKKNNDIGCTWLIRIRTDGRRGSGSSYLEIPIVSENVKYRVFKGFYVYPLASAPVVIYAYVHTPYPLALPRATRIFSMRISSSIAKNFPKMIAM